MSTDITDSEFDEDAISETGGEITYDRHLPAMHVYLGENFIDAFGSRLFYEYDSILREIPIILEENVVFWPGQTIPLYATLPATCKALKYAIKVQRYHAFICQHQLVENISCSIIAQVLSYKIANEDGVECVAVRAIGRQRVHLDSIETMMFENTDILMARDAKILIDYVSRNPLDYIRMPSLDRIFPGKSDVEWFGTSNTNTFPMVEKFYESKFTTIPKWILNRLDLHTRDWYNTLPITNSPMDVTDFSFWVASILPVKPFRKVKLLLVSDARTRLERVLAILEKLYHYNEIVCSLCEVDVGRVHDIISMSSNGPTGVYVNTACFMHEIVTVKSVRNVEESGRPKGSFSWFPNYKWKLLACSNCGNHIGWKFITPLTNICPSIFYAFTLLKVRCVIDSPPY
ncbi:Protein cereblon [Trichinella papuae]|uniref:Protein cereblon n=1 Tax=Trichinella papuae TaxID=268474 RepID=A0A0V1MS47_9BILA|nr:Protein cereblon [Trichinella papuae]